jgi:hypothetical protein
MRGNSAEEVAERVLKQPSLCGLQVSLQKKNWRTFVRVDARIFISIFKLCFIYYAHIV